MFKRKKIGLALGGGAAKGLAHIGVLKVLEENGIKPDFVSGTSIGAIVGSLYCSGYSAEQIEDIAKKTNWVKLFDPKISRKGLIKGDNIEKYLRELLEDKQFSELKIPLFIPAVDILKSQEIIFNKGDLVKAIRSSISIPGILRPIENNGNVLVDGGIIDNLPIDVLKDSGADIIIAVSLFKENKKGYVFSTALKENNMTLVPNMLTSLLNSLTIVEREMTKNILDNSKADILIMPDLKKINFQDFYKADEIIKIGEIETRNRLKDIKYHNRNIFQRIMGI